MGRGGKNAGWFDAERLLKQALRCGISVAEFWAMTPVETWMAIEAAIWQDEHRQRLDAILAWRTAALMRTKHMPSFKNYLARNTPQQVKVLRGEELEQRQAEYQEMATVVKEAAPALQERLAALQKRNARRRRNK